MFGAGIRFLSLAVSFAVAVCAGHARGDTLHVPSDQYPTIQSAIDAATDGDEVVVADGVYTGPGNRDLDFAGRLIAVRSEGGPRACIIDCEGTYMVGGGHRGFHFHSGESAAAVVDSFTIRGGIEYGFGGAIHCDGASPTIRNCIIAGNVVWDIWTSHGGGISSVGGSPAFVNCVIVGNQAGGGEAGARGGGIYCQGGAPSIIGCLFAGNYAGGLHGGWGGGVFLGESDALVINCAFSGNDSSGGGLLNDGGNLTLISCTFSGNEHDGLSNSGVAQVINCIFWGNHSWDLTPRSITGSDGVTVSYSVIEEGWNGPGTANIDLDPLLVDPDGADGEIGTVDDNLRLRPGSPCIDAGNGAALPPEIDRDVGGSARRVDHLDAPDCPHAPGTCGAPPVVDMGAYEFHLPCPWDLDYSEIVAEEDLAVLLKAWGTDPGGPPDFQRDGAVGITDLLALLARWGPCCGPAGGAPLDCNANGFPDACDLDAGESADCNGNGVPDECDFAGCDAGEVPKGCTFVDCNGNGVADPCDLSEETSVDCNVDGVPDECQVLGCAGCNHETANLIADDGGPFDHFGASVSLSGGAAIIGAPRHGSDDRGSVYAFRFDGSGWAQEQRITPDDAAAQDEFGRSVSMSGDLVLIGSRRTPGGSAYVFRFDDLSWVQERRLTASDASPGDDLGFSVCLDGALALAGAPDDDDAGASSGSAYVFGLDRSGPRQQKLVAQDGAEGDRFGHSVSLHGEVALIGAPDDDDHGGSSGSAYVFRFDGSGWVQEQKLTASDATAQAFGTSVSVSGDVALIGAPWSVAAYVFRFDGRQWVQEARLTGGDGGAIGSSGRRGEDDLILTVSTGFPGGVFVHLLDQASGEWVQQVTLTRSTRSVHDGFGTSLAIEGGVALVGDPDDYSHGHFAGSVFEFRSLSDCNGTDTLDLCDIGIGTSRDANGDGIPDECQ